MFFLAGAGVSALTCILLLTPDGPLAPIWRLKPQARLDFEVMGGWALLLLGLVGVGCGLSAVGLWQLRTWGHRLALAVLSANLVGDTFNAVFRGDLRTLIGLPIGGAMIAYLLSAKIRGLFGHPSRS